MRIKDRIIQKQELTEARGQKKVKLHEQWCGREYAKNNER